MVHNNEGLKGIDWSKAWPAIRKSGFEGWFAFETSHASPEQCIEDTKKNVAWVMKNAQG